MSWQGKGSQTSPQHGGARIETHGNVLVGTSVDVSPSTTYQYTKYYVISSGDPKLPKQDGATQPETNHGHEEGFVLDETTLVGTDMDPGTFEIASDVDVEKMDEWLKDRSVCLDLEGDDKQSDFKFNVVNDVKLLGPDDMDIHFYTNDASRDPCNVVNKPVTDTGYSDNSRIVDLEMKDASVDDGTSTYGFVKLESSGLTESEKQLLETVDDDLTALGFKETDKSNTLMTPQELESMPDRGLEFEESVGPKEKVVVEDAGGDSNGTTATLSSDEIAYDNGDYKAVVLASPHSSFSTSSVPISAVAISITTDKDSGAVTKIIINAQPTLKVNGKQSNMPATLMKPIAVNNLILSQGNGSNATDEHESAVGENVCNEFFPTTTIVLPVDQKSADTVKEELSSSSGVGCETNDVDILEDDSSPIKDHPGYMGENSKSSDKKSNKKVHTLTHSRDRPYRCFASGCDWAFTTAYKLRRHIETHDGKKEFMCDIEGCKKMFTTVYNLNTHKKLHVRPNTINCPVEGCNMMFPTRRQMELHLKVHDGLEAPYKCSLDSCGKEFYTVNSITTHMRVHSKGKLRCTFEGCNKVFDKPCRLKQHKRQHTGDKPYKCEFEGCGWAFVTASKLTRHMRKHTGERRFLCPEENCGKSFMRPEHLQGHMVVHSGSKPFECPHENCFARFTAKSSLYVHQKKHNATSEKMVYACPVEICDKKYNSKSSLRLHMLKFHSADSQMDYVTLLASDELQEFQAIKNISQEMIEGITVSVPSVAIPVNNIGSAVEGMPMSPNDFITSGLQQEASPESVITQLVMKQELNASSSGSISLNCVGDVPPPNIEIINDPSVMPTSRVSQANNSGSARTDYCSTHLLAGKRKFRNVQQVKLNFDSISDPVNTAGISSDLSQIGKLTPSLALAQNDMVLTATGITFHDPTNQVELVQTQLLQDDPPHGELYQDDNLLMPIGGSPSVLAGEFAVPISFLSEVAGSDVPSPDVTSIEVTEFSSSTINLRDLD